ncbi:hypothetical protein H072_9024 [Dactylellina haptotyla CBS 200.50]|uniref:Uncharacterized protein n=1 Tax=Dactylellina haptotyla (strain CBS 200.50) TaxID=1284197 RepID=S8A2J6_DACHA|nr:hypothetical protein H072_9024 [Dactylellina haptotyla CBS 200.50]
MYGAINKSDLLNERCLLLELPAELRLQIYSNVIGKHLVHVEADWKDPFGNSDMRAFAYECRPYLHTKCCQWSCHGRNAETEIYEYCMDPLSETDKLNRRPAGTANASWPHSMLFADRHGQCFGRKHTPYSRTMDLRFLRTCKSIYTDARYIAYNKATFSFRSSEIFDNFVLARTTEQLRNIRSLHFDISSAQSLEEWGQTFQPETILALSSLRELFLWIDFASGPDDPRNKRDYMETFEAEVYYKRPICFFRMCPLKEVRVFLNPGRWPSNELEDGHFGWSNIRSWSKEMEKRLKLKWDGPIDLLDA